MTPRRILVPVDFSAGSHAAVEYATRVASEGEAYVHLLHVTESGRAPRPAESQALAGDRRLGAYHRLAALMAGQRLDPFLTTGVVRRGEAADAIAEYAREMRADLIVMGIHGQEQATPDTPGRVIQGVLGRTTCPVIAVPEPGLEHAALHPHLARSARRAATWHAA